MRKVVIFAALLMLVLSVGRADHAPEWQMSAKKPETSLAGIRVGETSIGATRKKLGEPTRFRDLSDPGPGWKEAEYVWEQDGLLVEATTLYDSENRTLESEIVYSVKVSGTRALKKYVTGAGIGLGDNLSALIRAYGPVYLTSWRPASPGETTFTFIFRNETELSAGLPYEDGRIVSLTLSASIE